ncbi:MAG: hypothetical protein RRY80_12000 [Lachnospiraceae bacterium]
MTLKQLNILEDFVEAISDQSTFTEVSSNNLVKDIKDLFLRYLSEFKNDFKTLEWDFFSIEFWFDSGQLIIYPEKKISSNLECEEFERLDPYFYLIIEKYQIYFDDLFEKMPTDDVIDSESENYTNEVINCVSNVFKDLLLNYNLLGVLGREKIKLKYFGVTKEVLLKEELL